MPSFPQAVMTAWQYDDDCSIWEFGETLCM